MHRHQIFGAASNSAPSQSSSDEALAFLSTLIPVQDWSCRTAEHSDSYYSEPKQDASIDTIARYLHRTKQRHVILTGAPGVGKTTTAERLAVRVASSQYASLQDCGILYLDVRNVGEQDSRACIETIHSIVASSKRKLLLVLDNLASILTSASGRSNKPLLRGIIQRPNVSAVCVMSHWDYMEHVGNDLDMLAVFSRTHLEEPEEKSLAPLLRFVAKRLAVHYGITILDGVAEQSAVLSSTYILSEFQPGKSIDLLRRACDDLVFRRGHLDTEDEIALTASDLAHVVSEKSGIPIETISGQGRRCDFAAALSATIVGQQHAIKEVSTELALIAAGLAEPNKPASVMMFAGMTGVGKTELAKRIAEIYSSSGHLQVYPMGNYTEAHSVSGIVGVPPGYVGHEQGGRIVNDLHADPYSVFLLDEAEKCHPNVWKPFLNLFDEGWIIDQRGRKAYADRAIFILTTNAGDRSISHLASSGKSREEIGEHVRKTLSRVRQERSSQPVFPPQFLSRIRRIIVFSPLQQHEMVEIARRHINKIRRRWWDSRQKELQVCDSLVNRIGTEGDRINSLVNGEEGGRVIQKLARECIDYAILRQSNQASAEYENCSRILVELADSTEGDVESVIKSSVSFL